MTTERDELIEFFGEPISVYTLNQVYSIGALNPLQII
jgi:hypothetical protein